MLTPEMERLAPLLCASLSGMPFTLAGGTALALQLGDRISVDFDWFCPEDALPFRLGERFASLGLGLTPIQDTAHTFECLLAGVRCSFFSFRPRFEPASVSLQGMPLAPVLDIGANGSDTKPGSYRQIARVLSGCRGRARAAHAERRAVGRGRGLFHPSCSRIHGYFDREACARTE